MTKTKDITNINIEKLDKEIDKQLKEKEKNNKIISLCNKIIISLPIVFSSVYILTCISIMNYFDSLASFLFESSKIAFAEFIVLGSTATITTVIKNKTKKKNKELNEKLCDNFDIAEAYEFDKANSLEIINTNIKEEKLNNIKKVDLPQISIISNNKIKTRTLKKDNNNVRK